MELETITAYVSLGSNMGDRAGNLMLAVRGLLEASICVTRLSAIYETEPLEIDSASDFLNLVAEAHVTNVSPEQMLARMLRIEYLLGRKRQASGIKEPRTVDLDLLLYGNSLHETEFLTLPHPRMHLRNFVLVPLAELSPQFVHPVFKQTISDLLHASPDKSRVHRWQPNAELKMHAV
jgi:2-amino-4-hydroxy-6-hydroxymethyldihydropteridine diphosphokinase